MSAREEIADRLWVSVPSSDDAEAKATASRMLDAYRAEVLREAAEKIRDAPFEDHLLQKHQRARAANLIDPEDTP